MLILLTGGSANGKSTYAEKLALSMPGPHYYLAAMRIYDDECKRKVDRHRNIRGMSDFITIEKDVNVSDVEFPKMGCALLECMCNLTANEMFDECGNMADPDALFEKMCRNLQALAKKCTNLIVVTNEVGADANAYADTVRAYQNLLGRLNRYLADCADAVYEVVCGIPICRKQSNEMQDMAKEQNKVKERDMENCMKLLVIGGEGAGKREYVKQLNIEESEIEYGLHNRVLQIVQEELKGDRKENQTVDFSEKESAETAAAIARIKERTQALLPILQSKKVVICNEVGSGVIPIEKVERIYREETGRLCVLLAKQAESVVRVICGIPQKIK